MENTVADVRTSEADAATSLLKGLRILNLFSAEQTVWRVGEISVALGIAKSTASRIARTLEEEGFLRRLQHRDGYRLGIHLWELGSCAIVDSADLPRQALPYLEELVTQFNHGAQCVILDGTDVIYVQKVDAQSSLRPYMPLGARFPTHCTATGKALLAFLSDEKIDQILAQGLRRHTDRTITDPAMLRPVLQTVRSKGFAKNFGEWRPDIGGIAAPIFGRTGMAVGAIGITIPIAHFPDERDTSIPAAVIRSAQRLSQDLGHIAVERSL